MPSCVQDVAEARGPTGLDNIERLTVRIVPELCGRLEFETAGRYRRRGRRVAAVVSAVRGAVIFWTAKIIDSGGWEPRAPGLSGHLHGELLREIAVDYGVHQDTVRRRLIGVGVEVRDRRFQRLT